MFKFTITREGLSAIGKSGYREAGRKAIEAAALYWWNTYLPLHFQSIAYQRYRYEQRDKRTNAMKAARAPWPFADDPQPSIGEVKPLVFTGRSRERALSSPNIKAKAKNYETYRADVIINAPAFNFGVGKRIDMRDEVTRTTPQELVTLEDVFTREWNKQLKAAGLRAPRRTRQFAA